MVWKLLRKNISAMQIGGYTLASLVGLSIVISAVKFYGDVQSAFDDEESFISRDYIIISKTVSAMQTAGVGAETTFDDDDIADLRSQPWVRDVGAFTSAAFNVEARMNLGNRGMTTHLFFESLPDKFIDVKPEQWHFSAPAGDPATVAPEALADIEIPVIISRDYLTLYNFGFAATRGYPQLNEGLVQSVPIVFDLGGNGHYDSYRARVVGFSSRLNTIAVPQDFMDWANRRYSYNDDNKPSRLIIEANTPGDPAIDKYMAANGYEVAGDKADNSRASYFMTVVTGIVITVGAVISLLAFFILMLSIYLLLQKNRRKVHDLLLLGYSPGDVARCYYALIAVVNVTVAVLSIVIMLVASASWVERFETIGLTSSSPVAAIVTALAVAAVITTINCLAVRRIVRRNFYE